MCAAHAKNTNLICVRNFYAQTGQTGQTGQNRCVLSKALISHHFPAMCIAQQCAHIEMLFSAIYQHYRNTASPISPPSSHPKFLSTTNLTINLRPKRSSNKLIIINATTDNNINLRTKRLSYFHNICNTASSLPTRPSNQLQHCNYNCTILLLLTFPTIFNSCDRQYAPFRILTRLFLYFEHLPCTFKSNYAPVGRCYLFTNILHYATIPS